MIRILVGDVRSRLRDIPDGSVQCVVTSPPYFGLRDYSTASWDGGDPACDHNPARREPGEAKASTLGGGKTVIYAQEMGVSAFRSHCRKCGAVRVDNQIGLEPTLAGYIATMVDVFRDVRRVLRDDGTVFLNLGDSYAGGGGYYPGAPSNQNGSMQANANQSGRRNITGQRSLHGLKPKDLMMVPSRVAIALQDDGWWLRSDIIWAKKNCMPESVTDRPTSSHEHIFLLTKQPRYYYDAIAVAETAAESTQERAYLGQRPITPQAAALQANGTHGKSDRLAVYDRATRNLRNVWHLATEPFPDAHFATFPSEIPRRCIKAGTSECGQCADCGAPWVRVVEHGEPSKETTRGRQAWTAVTGQRDSAGGLPLREVVTTGWRPSCSCDADVVPQTVLDPFLGSGTTLLVADQLGRDGIGIELNQEYSEMARKRITNDAPMFVKVETT